MTNNQTGLAKQASLKLNHGLKIFVLILSVGLLLSEPMAAQESDDIFVDDSFTTLRSDVGIVGLTANLDWWNSFHYMGTDSLVFDNTHEIEIVFRDVRMISHRLGVGFMVMGSFVTSGSNFGLGGWGIGPVIRGYPFKTDIFMPYFQAQMLLGNNMGLGELSDTINEANGFRIRLGLKAGLGIRITDSFGIFIEFGPMWESSTLFSADSRVWQFNIGIDWYRFKK